MQNSSGPIGSPCWVPSSDRMIFFTCLRIGLQEYEACTKEESYYYYSYSYYYYCYYYPCSPLMFNLCFNTLMKTLSKPEFKSLGYIWGPPSKTTTCSWLQFADDAVIIASNVKNTQQLLNIFVAWCNWADMLIRLDKCSSFG